MKKITIGASERAELRQICNVIKANPTHYETVTYTNKDANAKLQVRFNSGDKSTYGVEVKIVMDCEVVSVDCFQSSNVNEIEGFIRSKCSVETLTESYATFLKRDSNNEIKEKTQKEDKINPLDLVLMDSLLLVRKSLGTVYRGQILNFKCARNNQGEIEIITSINTMFNNDLQYAGSMFYNLDRLAYDIRNGNLAILSHSAPTKVLRVYGWSGDYETIAVNQKARLSSVIEHFMIDGGSPRIEFRPLPESK